MLGNVNSITALARSETVLPSCAHSLPANQLRISSQAGWRPTKSPGCANFCAGSYVPNSTDADALCLIAAIENGLPPAALVEIPLHRLLDPALEALRGPPAELCLDFGGIDC